MSTQLIVRNDAALTVSLAPVALELKVAALESSALIGIVKDEGSQKNAVEALKSIKGVLKMVEDSRKTIKEPVLEMARQIDGTAKAFAADLQTEEIRLNTLIGNFQQEQLAIARRAEEARQAELRRIEEERIAAIRKAEAEARAVEEARQAELRRIAEAEAAATNAKQRAKLEAERASLEAKRKEDEAKAAAEAKRQAELSKQAMEAVGPQATTIKAAGQTVKETFDYEVVDMQLLQRMHPGFVRMEDNRSEIMAAITKGVREIKGLRIFPVVKTQVRANAPRVIDV